MPSDDENELLAHPEFWDARYSNAPEGEGHAPTHEWFRTYQDLELFFRKHLVEWRAPETNPRIVHLGSGDSVSMCNISALCSFSNSPNYQTIPQDLAKLGYSNQLCVDFSQVVVEKMAKRDANTTGIEWRQLDARSMENSIDSGVVDVAFDKGTLDAMIHGSPWNPPDDVKDNTGKYIREVSIFSNNVVVSGDKANRPGLSHP